MEGHNKLPAPAGVCFKNLCDAIAYGQGISSRSVVAYVMGDIDHVTPGAYYDYIANKNWDYLLETVRNLLSDNSTEDTSEIIQKKFLST